MSIGICLLSWTEEDWRPVHRDIGQPVVLRVDGGHDCAGTLPETCTPWRNWWAAPRARASASVYARAHERERAYIRDREDQRLLFTCCFMYLATKVATWAHAERSCSRPRTQIPNSFIRSFVAYPLASPAV